MIRKKSTNKKYKYIVGTFSAESILAAGLSTYNILRKIKTGYLLTDEEINDWKENNPELAKSSINRTDQLINILCEIKGWKLVSVDKFLDSRNYNTYITISFAEEIVD